MTRNSLSPENSDLWKTRETTAPNSRGEREFSLGNTSTKRKRVSEFRQETLARESCLYDLAPSSCQPGL